MGEGHSTPVLVYSGGGHSTPEFDLLSIMKISLNARSNTQFKPVLHSRRGQKLYFNEFCTQTALKKIRFSHFRAVKNCIFYDFRTQDVAKDHILTIFAIKARSKTIFQRILL